MKYMISLVVASVCVANLMSAATISGTTAILNTPSNFGSGGAAALTDGVVGGNNWLSGSAYLGWQDSGYIPNDSGVDSAVNQPQLTFDLGNLYNLDSVTIHYVVDYPPGSSFANVRAPDQVTVSFGASGTGGPFGGGFIETGFNDGPEGDGAPGGGEARFLTIPLGGVAADAVRLDFLSDGEWTFLSDVSFAGTVVPEPGTIALMSIGVVGLGLACRRKKL